MAQSVRILAEAGIVRPISPVKLLRTAGAVRGWGLGPAGGFAALAARNPDGEGLIDELGSLTFGEIDERGRRLANALRELGVRAGDGVAIMCRNHRGFIDASLGAARLGADMLYLNTAFAGPQLAEVVAREKPSVLVYDQEFEGLLSGIDGVTRIVAWVDRDTGGLPTVEGLIAGGSTTKLAAPPKPGRIVILTSGTTGTPKGAPRSEAGLDAAVALLSRIPIRRGWRVHIAAPLFHTWGLAHLLLGMLMETCTVLTRRFEPEECLRVATKNDVDEIVVIPVMLQRILRLPEDVRQRYDLRHVKVVASSGSALAGDLATEWMDAFGDNLYNTYGSTEVAYATIATPADLRAAPGTAGKPPLGTTVRLYDESDRPSPAGQPGRIFVGNGMLFEGYTGGGGKQVIDGLMSSGDVGRFDAEGRLFVEGRDDDMIVSGGENVFPQEIEDCLTRHDAVVEAAAIGIDDPEFGKRLRAFVVLVDAGAATEDELKDHVKQNLARYKVPREIVFLEELPRNATGKILKRVLADQ
ncbi:MAG TPA: AMP-binding protein [Nocardioidaceae bacterium]|nr:AMP-binding protein [Nocardioidaceae bacterium]